MKKVQSIILLIVLMFFIVREAEALRCGNYLILEGDYQYQVLSKCGEPVHKNTYYEEREYLYYGFYNTRVDVIELWTYNFGPRQSLYILRFRNGELEEITADGYGF